MPTELDFDEPYRVAEAIKLMGVKHAVITSVNRDELKDGGAAIWALTVKTIRALNPATTLETLIPDFKGNMESVDAIIEVAPEIVSHNMETIPRLYRRVRPQAKYERSLSVIRRLNHGGIRTKSGIMAGLGETQAEVFKVMDDLREAGCHVLTIGQYLQPSRNHLEVMEWIHPDIFKEYELAGLSKGFKYVESGPLVRSSYHAEKHVR
jgi:lipoic acid synthetase